MSVSKNGALVVLAHGDGGSLTTDLIRSAFLTRLGNPVLNALTDAAVLDPLPGPPVVTTDSFVVHPYFFPGGDIGRLAVAGTVNDLAVSGAVPLYLTAGFVLEEGFPMADLELVVASMAETAREAGVTVVAGDTKVVERGKGDGIYITTTGVGYLPPGRSLGFDRIRPGDAVIVTGGIAEHGTAILSRRAGLEFETPVVSDCAPVARLTHRLLECCPEIRFMRDPTRGGLATTLKEIAEATGHDILLWEEHIPLKPEVSGALEFLGLDPLYLASEGRVVIIAPPDRAEAIVDLCRTDPLGADAAVAGVVREGRGHVYLKTPVGGTKWIDRLAGDPLPRIC